jgi:hypothetical protein
VAEVFSPLEQFTIEAKVDFVLLPASDGSVIASPIVWLVFALGALYLLMRGRAWTRCRAAGVKAQKGYDRG